MGSKSNTAWSNKSSLKFSSKAIYAAREYLFEVRRIHVLNGGVDWVKDNLDIIKDSSKYSNYNQLSYRCDDDLYRSYSEMVPQKRDRSLFYKLVQAMFHNSYSLFYTNHQCDMGQHQLVRIESINDLHYTTMDTLTLTDNAMHRRILTCNSDIFNIATDAYRLIISQDNLDTDIQRHVPAITKYKLMNELEIYCHRNLMYIDLAHLKSYEAKTVIYSAINYVISKHPDEYGELSLRTAYWLVAIAIYNNFAKKYAHSIYSYHVTAHVAMNVESPHDSVVASLPHGDSLPEDTKRNTAIMSVSSSDIQVPNLSEEELILIGKIKQIKYLINEISEVTDVSARMNQMHSELCHNLKMLVSQLDNTAVNDDNNSVEIGGTV